MTDTIQTVRDVVAQDFRTAAVFQKYGLDFCCGGGATIQDACDQKGIDATDVCKEVEAILTSPRDGTPDFSSWEIDFLADYIVANHHSYVKRVLPTVRHHAEKVARVHGANHPETVRIEALFSQVADELESHMVKEEMILFPYVHMLATAARQGGTPARPMFGTIRNPINVMEIEHDQAGDALHEIRRLSGEYTPPSDACMTYRVLFQELAEFEADLHKHVHLENNILFPKTIALEELLLVASNGE